MLRVVYTYFASIHPGRYNKYIITGARKS